MRPVMSYALLPDYDTAGYRVVAVMPLLEKRVSKAGIEIRCSKGAWGDGDNFWVLESDLFCTEAMALQVAKTRLGCQTH